MRPFTTELRVPPDAAFASLVESFAADAARRSGLAAESELGIVTAARCGFDAMVDEALAQARDPIRVVASCTPADLVLSLYERGLPMDDAYARRDPRWNELALNVDSAHWRGHGTAGSELRLVVKRPHDVHAAPEPPPAQDVPLAPEQEYTIRRLVPSDASGVARAFYLTYGFAYDLAAVYVPQRLVELNESGRYVSIVATTAASDVVGHCALARDADEPIADLAGAIVLPAHRGRALLNRMLDQAEIEARALGLAAYFSEPVTDHPRTQRSSESYGMTACGITLGEAPRNFLARHMDLAATTQRQTCMLYVKPLRPPEPRTIFAPARHREIIEEVYRRLGVPIAMARGTPREGRGTLRTAIACLDGTGTITVEAVGAESAALARQATEDLRATRRLGAIYASLPLEDPGTPALCEAMETSGFYFSGVGPWMLKGRDALRLQLPLTEIDLSALVVIDGFGKDLLEYVARERDYLSSRESARSARMRPPV